MGETGSDVVRWWPAGPVSAEDHLFLFVFLFVVGMTRLEQTNGFTDSM